MRRRSGARDEIRTHHDEWIKRALSLWLTGLGEVQVDARVAGESRRVDVLYQEKRADPARRRRLGVLGDLARGSVLFEAFRNPPTTRDLKSCLLKAVDHDAGRARAARRAKRKLSSVGVTVLCVITPSLSDEIAAQAEVTLIAADKPGLFRLAPMWNAALVVVNELPEDASTVWLRLFGRGEVQARAVRELLDMNGPLRDGTLRLLVAWQRSLPPVAEMSDDEREMTMNLERVYEQWEKKTLAKGKAEGKVEGQREGKVEGKAEGRAEAVLIVLESRGLAISAAQRKQVLGCADIEQLDAWVRAAVTTPSVKALLAGPRAK